MHEESGEQVKSTPTIASIICVTSCLLCFLVLKPHKSIYFSILQLNLFVTLKNHLKVYVFSAFLYYF